jgi:cytochrome P450
MTSNRPESDIDLFCDEVLRDPYPAYRELRGLGAAVWMRPVEMFALSRFEDVREALRNWEVFSSARGAAMNAEINEAIAGNTLGSDPPKHRQLRDVLVRPLLPAAMREVNALIEGEAERIVEHLVTRPSFDAAVALAQHLPLTVVTRAFEIDGVTLPPGSRAMVLYGSANRDERKWIEPERFDIRRKAAEQLAFGHGEHLCVGLPLARLEMRAILESLARRVKRFDILELERGLNNTLRGIKHLEVATHRT